MRYIGDCVSLGGPGITQMVDDAIDISYRTFRRQVGGKEVDHWASRYGYEKHPSQGLTLPADWHVSYHRSKWQGKRCYYLRWSAYEHVWVDN